jgi:hypothetical protein
VGISADDYRAELAGALAEAAAQQFIPRTFRAHSRALVVEFTDLVQCGWYVHKLARSDSRIWWAAVQPFPPHYTGIMPEFGNAIGELRELMRRVETEIRAAEAMYRLRRRLFGPVTPLDMPQQVTVPDV